MHDLPIERRSAPALAASVVPAAGPYRDPTNVIRQGMAIQASLGTRSAVEFLKAHDVHGQVIHRVLMGEQIRSDDQAALADAAPG